MKKLLLGLLFFFFCFCLPLAAQDAEPSQLSSIQTRLSQAVWTAFDNYESSTNELIQSSQIMIVSLQEQVNLSEQERLISEKHLQTMTNLFQTLSIELKSLRESVADWMNKYYKALIPLIFLSCICILNIMGKIVIWILTKKGVKVPFSIALWV